MSQQKKMMKLRFLSIKWKKKTWTNLSEYVKQKANKKKSNSNSKQIKLRLMKLEKKNTTSKTGKDYKAQFQNNPMLKDIT